MIFQVFRLDLLWFLKSLSCCITLNACTSDLQMMTGHLPPGFSGKEQNYCHPGPEVAKHPRTHNHHNV